MVSRLAEVAPGGFAFSSLDSGRLGVRVQHSSHGGLHFCPGARGNGHLHDQLPVVATVTPPRPELLEIGAHLHCVSQLSLRTPSALWLHPLERGLPERPGQVRFITRPKSRTMSHKAAYATSEHRLLISSYARIVATPVGERTPGDTIMSHWHDPPSVNLRSYSRLGPKPFVPSHRARPSLAQAVCSNTTPYCFFLLGVHFKLRLTGRLLQVRLFVRPTSASTGTGRAASLLVLSQPHSLSARLALTQCPGRVPMHGIEP